MVQKFIQHFNFIFRFIFNYTQIYTFIQNINNQKIMKRVSTILKKKKNVSF